MRHLLLLTPLALALAPAFAQRGDVAPADPKVPVDSKVPAAGTAAVDSGVAAVDSQARLQAYLALTFDRSPALVLEVLTRPAEPKHEPAPAADLQPDPAPSVAPPPADGDRVSGTWALTVESPILPQAIEATFALSLADDGTTITGSLMAGRPGDQAVAKGTLVGDVIELQVEGEGLGSGRVNATLGEANSLSGTLETAGMVLDVTGIRTSGSTAPPPAKAAEPPGGPFAAETEAFQELVTRGEWEAVAEVLASFPNDDGQAVYRHLLAVLAAPPGSQVRPGPEGPVIQPARPGPEGPLAQQHALTPFDLRGLADAAPRELDDDALDLLGQLLTAVIGQGHALDQVLEAWRGGTARLGGDDPERRHAVARILLAADRPREAGAFLPSPGPTVGAKTLALVVRHHLGLHQLEPKLEQLELAWTVTGHLLAATRELEPPATDASPQERETAREDARALRKQALAWAVDLAPRVREALGDAWLAAVFQDEPERGREVLGAIGAGVALGRAPGFRDPEQRLRGLRLQQTAVEALFTHAPERAADGRQVLGLMLRNWLVEAELTQAMDQSLGGGRAQPRYDNFGNLYFVQQRGQNSPNQPVPIATVDVLGVHPGEAWRDLAGESLRARLFGLSAELHLKASDEDEAFPLIEALAALPGQADRAHELAEELLRVWTQNHDLNDSGRRRNQYFFWGFEQRADAIPLTRSKQERNLVELGQLLTRLRALPLEPLDEKLLADAFIRSHSAAEVYQLEAIEGVFGPPGDLEPPTLARLIQTMRANLAGLWRDPRVQKEKETKRTDRELKAEVLRGYEVAGRLAGAGLAEYPERWELILADAAVRYDQSDYQLRELRPSGDYTAARQLGFERFAAAAAAYASTVPDLAEEDESNDVYDVWFSAGLGACDLPRISHEHLPDARQPALIRAALEALPGEAAERHLKRFANSLFSRMSSVNPAVKFDYLRAGFEIAGEREEAREAKQVFDYYQDLVTEIQLRTRIDGSDRVGHGRPFGLFVELRHTEEIERESGGFAKYLQNQNAQNFGWNYGRPLEDYRDKFEEAARALLQERFLVHSITFADPKVESRGDPEHGWRLTPYVYVLLQARGPEVDEVPAIALDLDFLDTSGYAVLPVESAPLPIDARPDVGDPRPLQTLQVTQSLDERRAGEGILALEIQAQGHGLVPPLEELLDMEALDPAFEVVSIEDPGLGAEELDLESEELAVVSARRWLLELRGKAGLASLPKTFRFPTVALEGEVLRQRYADADLVDAGETVALEARYGQTAARWPWALAGLLALFLLAGVARAARQPALETPAGPFAPPAQTTPFAVLALLQRIEAANALDPSARAELRRVIATLEQRHFASADASSSQASGDLAEVARQWASRGNAAVG